MRRRFPRVPASLKTKIAGAVAVFILLGVATRVLLHTTTDPAPRHPLYSDVNTACLNSVRVKLDDILALNYSRNNDIDITDWDHTAICSLTETESEFQRPSYDNIFNVPDEVNGRQLTLVTHFSDERFDLFLRLVNHWPGHISAAVQVAPDKVEEFVNTFCRHEELFNRKNILIHLVLQRGIFYPYNHLRNVALERSRTSHVFVSDSDLLPSRELEDKALQLIQEYSITGQQVLVVPSFEMLTSDVTFPETKEKLLAAWDAKQLQEFYATRYAPAYMPLNYTTWRTATEPYEIAYWSEFEPYVIAEKSQLQPYTERFVGRFYNKATHSAELFSRGFKFVVAPGIYNVHMWHESIHQKAFDAYFQCLYSLYQQFKTHLSVKYGVSLPPKAPLKPDGT